MKTLALAVAALIASGPAFAQNFAAPTNQPLVVESVQLGIKSPASKVCPNKATLMAWIKTSKPGTVRYMIARKGGGVAGPFAVTAKAAKGGGYAVVQRVYPIHHPIDAEYRILIHGGSGKMSNWAPMKASCKIKLGG